MPFWDSSDAFGGFVSHFSTSPAMDFGRYAKGYASAAKGAAESVLEGSFADYEAYPAVFLYRHALELYLKCVITKGIRLSSLTGQAVVAEISYSHDLQRLFVAAECVLRKNFSIHPNFEPLLVRLRGVVLDFHELDSSSFTFRYPVDKKGGRLVTEPIYANLARISEAMDAVLEELGTVDFVLDATVDEAQEVLEMMQSAHGRDD